MKASDPLPVDAPKIDAKQFVADVITMPLGDAAARRHAGEELPNAKRRGDVRGAGGFHHRVLDREVSGAV
jgi:hypothetical protein